MLSNKILPDESRAGNENRAHIGKAGRYQQMTPRSADGPIGGGMHDPTNSVPAPDIPRDRGICSSTPMNKDPHIGGRHSNENRTMAPGEKNRSAEPGRRIYGRDTSYKY
jgi:hypothetical protein